MVELARQGQGKMKPLYGVAPELNLTGQQKAAALHVLMTPDQVSIVRGAAGAGKTTMLKAVSKQIEAAGKKPSFFAPSADASRGVLREEGFAEADTVAKLLADKKMQAALKNQVMVIDEAGLLGTKNMTGLLKVATEQNARLILVGDTRQHRSVDRGDALRILNTVAGIKFAEVSKIYRQKNAEYRAAVEDLSEGKVKDGFEKLEKIQAIKDADPLKPHQQMIDDYMEAMKKGKSVLMVCPTHKQGDEATDEIRARLRKEKRIGKKEITAERLSNLNLTEAQKSDVRNFQAGHIIQFNQNMPGFKRGGKWTVESADEKEIKVKNAQGEIKPLPTDHGDRFDIYARQEIQLSKGDKIRITRGGTDADNKRLDNGQMFDVLSVSKKKIKLRNKNNAVFSIDKEFGHIAHAHCITSHASQGKTVDEVFIYQPAATFPATDAKQFYVSVSRGRNQAHIYTDNKEELLQHAQALGERKSAMELIDQEKKKKQKSRNVSFKRQRNLDQPQRPTQKEMQPQLNRDDHEPDR